jgi:hypothetical protein
LLDNFGAIFRPIFIINPISSKAESQGRPLVAVNEESHLDDPSMAKGQKPRTRKIKKKKKKPTAQPTVVEEEESEEANRDGWMLTRRSGGGHRSSAAGERRRTPAALLGLGILLLLI